jgi:hypothetical protein
MAITVETLLDTIRKATSSPPGAPVVIARALWISPSSFAMVAGHWKANELALLVLHVILKFRPEDEEHAPARQNVADDVGWAVGVADKIQRVQVGTQLLRLAEKAGLIRPIVRKGIRSGRNQRALVVIRLTPAASKRLGEYTKRFADMDFPEEPTIQPPFGEIWRNPNRRGKSEAAPLPPAYVEAKERLRQTPWRVNEFVMKHMVASLDEDELEYVFSEAPGRDWHSEAARKDRLMAIRTAAKFRHRTFYLDASCDSGPHLSSWSAPIHRRRPYGATIA